jgi:hypothetical protein
VGGTDKRGVARLSVSSSSAVPCSLSTVPYTPPGPIPAAVLRTQVFLRDALSAGPMSAKDLFAQARSSLAVCIRTVRRASATLPITKTRNPKLNCWTWSWSAPAPRHLESGALNLQSPGLAPASALRANLSTAEPARSNLFAQPPVSDGSTNQRINGSTILSPRHLVPSIVVQTSSLRPSTPRPPNLQSPAPTPAQLVPSNLSARPVPSNLSAQPPAPAGSTAGREQRRTDQRLAVRAAERPAASQAQWINALTFLALLLAARARHASRGNSRVAPCGLNPIDGQWGRICEPVP